VLSIVEIGSYLGASATAFAAALQATSNTAARVYCVDTWNNDAMTEGQRETMRVFLGNVHKYGETIVPIRGWSTTVVDEIARNLVKIDVLFIDGDHSYEGCLADWRAYEPLLRPGSRVAFHDVAWAGGVRRVVEEEVLPRSAAHARLPNLWWAEIR